MSKIKCSKCAEQVLSDPDDLKGSQCVLHLQYAEPTCYRQKGGLFYASEGVLKVLKATEAAFRRKVVETTQQISFDSKLDLKIQVSILEELGTSPFDGSTGHFFDHKLGQKTDHLSSLLRTVVSTYLQMRLKTYARKYTAEIACANVQLLYNILLQINCYTGNVTTKCHSKSMSDNRDLTETFHQKVSSLLVSIASDSRYFQSS